MQDSRKGYPDPKRDLGICSDGSHLRVRLGCCPEDLSQPALPLGRYRIEDDDPNDETRVIA